MALGNASQSVGAVRRVDLQLEGSYDGHVQGAKRTKYFVQFPPYRDPKVHQGAGSDSISAWFLKLVSVAAYWRLNKSARIWLNKISNKLWGVQDLGC